MPSDREALSALLNRINLESVDRHPSMTTWDAADRILASDWLTERDARMRGDAWDECAQAIFDWWSADADTRPAFVVNPYGVGLSDETFMEQGGDDA